MTLPQVEKLLTLPTSERLQLVELLWESIQADAVPDELTPEERRIVESRIREYRAAPDRLMDWQEVKSKAFGA